jgi:hypothetical protein
MVSLVLRSLVFAIMLGCVGLPGGSGFASAQNGTSSGPAGTKPEDAARPLPDLLALMQAVQVNQRKSEAIEKDYMYRQLRTFQELDGHGGMKKTETEEYDVFWLNGVPVHRLMKKNGKELSAQEQKKESDKIDQETAKAKERRAKADEKGTDTDPHGYELVTVSRLLELGSFTNARRVQLNGRDTIAVDFRGDPKAKTKNRLEAGIRDMEGTAWMDEQDRMLVKAQGHFVNNFKVAGGMVANIKKGTSFSMEQRKVNNEVWLPAKVDAEGSARALLLFNVNGNFRVVESDYRKFKATSKILPGMGKVDPEPKPNPK